MSVKLSVNIDHIATIREARKIREPDPVAGATIAELAGCHGISVHLREDRRHIQERDVRLLRGIVTTHLNLEMAPTPEMIQLAIDIQPDMVTLVPENQEVTTEGGLNVAARIDELAKAVASFKNNDIAVSVFIDPDTDQVKAAKKIGSDFVELHTGHFANAFDLGSSADVDRELVAIQDMTVLARKYGLRVNAGQGLNYRNVGYISSVSGIEELTIGHSIIGRAVMNGMDRAVREMLEAIRLAEH
ncbi:MAG: pyridoxine 5'-phosphate synthase [Fibrobacter sp.]|jgi:pyridoxine 5-phosphate synthase|nr:pyridoxine 5'-phosphate synthase [Fibrobacter sp.]MDY6368372.1 pyridoxine 5'-phosphate synthase [Fibrobacter sp.]MDY6389172.1 pyridoxine 5'-phosphate synthase [Fibrobacter sp.]